MTLRTACVAALLASPAIPPAAAAQDLASLPPGPGATVKGVVRMTQAVPPAVRRPAIAGLGLPAPAAAMPIRPVIYLERAPAGAFDTRPAGRARMTQRQETFFPSALAVQAGATVDFPNEDETYHNVFSLSRTRRFDLGRYAAGQSRAVRFDQPGVVRVFCDIHSHMSAFILVFNHGYFATAGEDGRYEIPGVPPGTYAVAAWHDGQVRAVQTLVVPQSVGIVALDFELH